MRGCGLKGCGMKGCGLKGCGMRRCGVRGCGMRRDRKMKAYIIRSDAGGSPGGVGIGKWLF